MLVATPLITAIIGLLIEQHMGYGMLPILLSIALALIVIRLLNSPIAPAIPAGLLPIFLEEKSWWYPAAILFGTTMLVLGLQLYKRIFSGIIPQAKSPEDRIDDIVEKPPRRFAWLPYFTAFLLVDSMLARLTGLRFVLFPPLVVIAYEMFAHPHVCPWADKPIRLVVACVFSAAAGVAIAANLGNNPLFVMLAMAAAILAIRSFRLHAPPAVAVGLLPFVIEHPDFGFALSVGLGTILLVLAFFAYRHFRLRASPARRTG